MSEAMVHQFCFCPHRITIDKQEVAFGWDVAFRVTPNWVAPPPPSGTAINKGIHEHKWDTVKDIGMFVRAFMLELGSLQQSVPVNIERVVSRWKPPDAPLVKINFDAGFGGSEKLASTGVIRDNEEALAGVQALQFAADLGFTYVILEGDARSVFLDLLSEGMIDQKCSLISKMQVILCIVDRRSSRPGANSVNDGLHVA
ncbi:hypothetical protein GOBAR_DD31391 [Gossypium barbadense]|nr:hypothetical protein GOBAR_DD31391 [Gossypium barbadense]